MLLSGVRVTFSDFDFINQGNNQFTWNGFQLQKHLCPLHQVRLLLGFFLVNQFTFDLRKPLFQAAFFLQEGLVQIGKLAVGKEAGNLV